MKPYNGPKEKKDLPQTITNDPDEAMNDAESVEESNDNKIDEDYNGYPHYPAKDDILNPANDMMRVNADVENISDDYTNHKLPKVQNTPIEEMNSIDESEMLSSDFTDLNDDRLTVEDLQNLGEINEDMDDGDDEDLKKHGWTPSRGEDVNFENENNNDLINEDEENDFYSLGDEEKHQ